MKYDGGTEHDIERRMIGIFWFWWGCEEILSNRVIDGCSRGGEEGSVRRSISTVVAHLGVLIIFIYQF